MKYTMKKNTFEAKLVTIENMSMVEEWCGGSIKGTKLPACDRIIAVRTPLGEDEADVGDYIADLGNQCFYVFRAAAFLQLYQEAK